MNHLISNLTNRIRATLVAGTGGEIGTLASSIRTDPVGTTAQPITMATGAGHTLAYAKIAQVGPATTSVVGADATRKIKVVSYVVVMDTGGATFKFASAATDKTGAMPCAQYGGAAVIGTTESPLLETAANEALNIITVGGAANGHVSYFLEA